MGVGAIGNTQAAAWNYPQNDQAAPSDEPAQQSEASSIEYGSQGQGSQGINYEDISQKQNQNFQHATKDWPDDLDAVS